MYNSLCSHRIYPDRPETPMQHLEIDRPETPRYYIAPSRQETPFYNIDPNRPETPTHQPDRRRPPCYCIDSAPPLPVLLTQSNHQTIKDKLAATGPSIGLRRSARIDKNAIKSQIVSGYMFFYFCSSIINARRIG